MSPALATVLFVTLAGLLAVSSAAAGALWWRARSWPAPPADLADRLESIEAILSRFEPPRADLAAPAPPASHLAVTPRRVEAAPALATGPTLIAVPDLAAPAADAGASAELGRRFGAIWERADAGATPEAIAKATGQPIGQVELILGLRRQLAAGAGGRG